MKDEPYYKIGELGRMFGITSRTIRFYEELGLLESCSRDHSEHRRYSERNVIRLKRIQQLKDYGLTLAEISEVFELARKDRSGEIARKNLAKKYRHRLDEAKKRKAALDAYIDDISWHIEQLEKEEDFFGCPGAACGSCAWYDRCDVRALLSTKKEKLGI
ncbi:hypothetical protein MASR2M29_20950 [Spirochaetota bacterium]